MTQTLSKFSRIASCGALAAVLAFFGSISAHAVVQDNDWERPVLQSRMDIVEAQPGMTNARQVQLIMTKKDGSPALTGFTLRIDRQVINFEISRVRHDVCGTELYIGMTSADAPEHSYRLVVVDHSHETCRADSREGLHAFPIASSLEALLLDRNEPVLRMTGEPEPVITPQ